MRLENLTEPGRTWFKMQLAKRALIFGDVRRNHGQPQPPTNPTNSLPLRLALGFLEPPQLPRRLFILKSISGLGAHFHLPGTVCVARLRHFYQTSLVFGFVECLQDCCESPAQNNPFFCPSFSPSLACSARRPHSLSWQPLQVLRGEEKG